MHVLDSVLAALEAEIGAHPPERGGALLGPRGHPLVSDFLPDPEAVSWAVTWSPSRALDAGVKEREREGLLELKGLVHSHPPGLDAPSAQDARELAEGLARNGHMASYLAPVLTHGRRVRAPELGAHELALPSGKVSFFAAHRLRGGGAEVRPEPVRAVPLGADLRLAAQALGAGSCQVHVAELEGAPVLAGRIALPGLELLLLASQHYPALPPVLLSTPEGGPTAQRDLSWSLALPGPERLLAALRGALPERFGAGAGTGTGAGAGPPGAGAGVGEPGGALFARSEGILTRALLSRRVLVAGCGSVGSYLAEALARSGVGAFTLLDAEPVEGANLSRSVYEAGDVGRSKVAALAARLRRIAPALRAEERATTVQALGPEALDALVRGADLVLAATDDPAAQRALDRFAYARGKPALFVGLYAGAQGGEVVVTVPGRTPCFRCATRARHEAEAAAGRVSGEVDYGTGRLRGEMALGVDVHHVASAAAKLALALLLGDEAGPSLRAVLDAPLRDGMPYLTLSTVPRYWFYPALFEGVPGQGAFQSAWLTPRRSDGCTVCGPAEGRLEPLEVPLGTPGRGELEPE